MRRRGDARLGVPRVARRRRAQDGERRDGAGLRRAGVPRRHPHPAARRRWGLSDGVERRADRARPQGRVPAIDTWNRRHLQIIFFGREYCPALRHDFAVCPICSFASSKKRHQRGEPDPALHTLIDLVRSGPDPKRARVCKPWRHRAGRARGAVLVASPPMRSDESTRWSRLIPFGLAAALAVQLQQRRVVQHARR